MLSPAVSGTRIPLHILLLLMLLLQMLLLHIFLLHMLLLHILLLHMLLLHMLPLHMLLLHMLLRPMLLLHMRLHHMLFKCRFYFMNYEPNGRMSECVELWLNKWVNECTSLLVSVGGIGWVWTGGGRNEWINEGLASSE
eukprot:jgi/Botrbrau1/3636/Bobra.0204s0027.1